MGYVCYCHIMQQLLFLGGGSGWLPLACLSISARQSSNAFPGKGVNGNLMTRGHVQTDVDIIFGTCLDPDSLVCPRKTLSLRWRNLPTVDGRSFRQGVREKDKIDAPIFKICLGADDDTGNVRNTAIVYYLVIDYLNHVERFPRGDGVNEDISMDSYCVFGSENGVLVLLSPTIRWKWAARAGVYRPVLRYR